MVCVHVSTCPQASWAAPDAPTPPLTGSNRKAGAVGEVMAAAVAPDEAAAALRARIERDVRAEIAAAAQKAADDAAAARAATEAEAKLVAEEAARKNAEAIAAAVATVRVFGSCTPSSPLRMHACSPTCDFWCPAPRALLCLSPSFASSSSAFAHPHSFRFSCPFHWHRALVEATPSWPTWNLRPWVPS